MARPSPLLEELLDRLAPLGHVAGRAMFGGHGLYVDGAMAGILVAETLYLKVDDGNRPAYEAAGMQPFVYSAKGRPVAMSFWEVPAEVLEEPERLRAWVAEARAAARRSQSAKPPRRR